MALIACPECSAQVSDKAASCPHCGHPIAAIPAGLTPVVPAASDVLDAKVQQYVARGYRVASRTPTSAQLVHPKTFSFLWATLWFLLFGVGLFIYIFYFLAKSDETVYLAVDAAGNVQLSGNVQSSASGLGRWMCPHCDYYNHSARQVCKSCRVARPIE